MRSIPHGFGSDAGGLTAKIVMVCVCAGPGMRAERLLAVLRCCSVLLAHISLPFVGGDEAVLHSVLIFFKILCVCKIFQAECFLHCYSVGALWLALVSFSPPQN